MTCRRTVRKPRASERPRGQIVPFEEQEAQILLNQAAAFEANVARLRASGDADAAEPFAENAKELRRRAAKLRERLRNRLDHARETTGKDK